MNDGASSKKIYKRWGYDGQKHDILGNSSKKHRSLDPNVCFAILVEERMIIKMHVHNFSVR
jgi:hypothetical protein